ncbi:hypothetical protein L7F22_034726 [Adiantum nelumboides]|nr:hypothetical protein [Adiantum nelumboides]
MDIVESRWTFMSRPIHGMAAMLHPLYKTPALFMDTSLSTLQTNYINKVFSEEEQLAIDAEFASYMNSLGPSFVRAVATREEATKFPLTWWQIHGRIGLPKLCRLALRILSQVAACFDHRVNFFSKITVRAGDTILRSEVKANTEVRREKLSSSASVHPTAIVHQGAIIQEDVVIGPFCTVGPAVKLGKGCLLHANSHVLGESEIGEGCILHAGAIVGADVPGRTTLGKQNVIGHYAVVGIRCQDLKYKEGDGCHLHIGNRNYIREFVSIHRSSSSSDQTTIGNGNLIMGTCHVAHDCKLGDGNILANATLLGGHVILQDYVHTGGGVAVHQRCQIDSYAFVAGGSMVVRDVPMYVMVSGDRAQICGLNVEGLTRHNFGDNEAGVQKYEYLSQAWQVQN